MKLLKAKRSWVIGLAVCATIGAGTAYAAGDVYFDGYMPAGSDSSSPLSPLTSSEGLSKYGSTVCMSATPNGGGSVCTGSASGAGKPYNGSQRNATCRPADGHAVSAKCRYVY